MSVPRGVADLHARFCGALTHRYFIRVHMSAMLVLVLLTGALTSRLLLKAGVTGMGLRYPIAVLVSYLVFFGLVRMWLAYVCTVAAAKRRASGESSDDGGSLLDGSGGSGGSSGGGGGGGSGGRFFSGGGGSGGGGSSGGFGDADVVGARPAVPMPVQASASGGGGSSGGKGGGLSLDLDGDGVVLLILFALLVIAIFGAGAYIVYQAPAILSEAAFQAVLAGGLVRAARGSHDPGWAGSILKATFIPFAIVIVLAGVFGYEAHKRCPTARTAREVMRTCVFH